VQRRLVFWLLVQPSDAPGAPEGLKLPVPVEQVDNLFTLVQVRGR
jgi:hypothetical protein